MDTDTRMSFLRYLRDLMAEDYAVKGHEPGTAVVDLDEFLDSYFDAAYETGRKDGHAEGVREGELGLML
jgi:hypothetical protein